MKKGFIQIYTGEGKGKTTAAVGLAVRAAGAGLKVFIGQFIKGMHSGELASLAKLRPRIIVRQFGGGRFIRGKPSPEDVRIAREGFAEIETVVKSGKYDVVILDEITHACKCGLVGVDEVLELLKSKPEEVEIVLTGRNADKRLVKAADLVTEMRAVKHYFKKGIRARRGIEV